MDELDEDWGIGKTLKRVWIDEGPKLRTLIGPAIEYGETGDVPALPMSWNAPFTDDKPWGTPSYAGRTEPVGVEKEIAEALTRAWDESSDYFRKLGTLIIRCLEQHPEMEGLIKDLIDDRVELDKLIEYNRDRVTGFKGD